MLGRKLTAAGSAGALVAVALAACGSSGSKPPCMVLANGNQLCGQAAVSWCELNNVGIDTTDYPLDSPTHQACVTVSNWADRDKGHQCLSQLQRDRSERDNHDGTMSRGARG